jgi:hypothetical protein
MTQPVDEAVVRRSVTVEVSQQRAFEVFTANSARGGLGALDR